jgi:flagellin
MKIASAANRLESVRQTQINELENLTASNSICIDTDIAQEATDLARNQILQQISTSLFSQAHQITGNLALRLLGV